MQVVSLVESMAEDLAVEINPFIVMFERKKITRGTARL
jgi:hypothetical protein